MEFANQAVDGVRWSRAGLRQDALICALNEQDLLWIYK